MRSMIKIVGIIVLCTLFVFSVLSSGTHVTTIEKPSFNTRETNNDGYGVDLFLPPEEDGYCKVNVNETAVFYVTVTNTGTLDDTVELAAGPKSNPDIFIKINGVYTAGFFEYAVSLPSGASDTLKVTVYIGRNLAHGEWTIAIAARSQNDTTVQDEIYLIVDVEEYGKICGYVYASDGITPLENAGVTFDAVDCIWPTDENGYYEIDGFFLWGEHDGQLDMYAYPPSDFFDEYMSSFEIANIKEREKCWVNFILDDYKTNTAPENFRINGPTSCKVGEEYEYTFSADDSESDQIYFMILWGDNTQAYFSFYTADAEGKRTITKTWNSKDSYTIWGCAIDKYGFHSESATLEISVPKNKLLINSPFNQFLERFPVLAWLLHISSLIEY